MNVVLFFALLAAVFTVAIWRGGGPERVVVAILLPTALLDRQFVLLAERVWATREVGILLLDMFVAGAVLAVALHAERIWPMVMAAFLIVGVELQLGVWLSPIHHRQVYRIAHAASAYPTLLILLIGTIRHARRSAQGRELDWTRFRPKGRNDKGQQGSGAGRR